MKEKVTKGSTDVSIFIRIRNSSDEGVTGLAYNTANLVCYFYRPGAAAVTAITLAELATPAINDLHLDGGFIEIDSSNWPGLYRLDLPDTVCASGVNKVYIVLKGATGMTECPVEIQLQDVDVFDGTRAGLIALPNAAADGAGGLPVSDAGGLDIDTLLSRITANVATESKQDVIDSIVDAIKAVTDNLPNTGALTDIDTGINNIEAKLPTNYLMGSSDQSDKDDEIGAIKAKTDNLPSDPADQSLIIDATDAIINAISALHNFNPSSDQVLLSTTAISAVVAALNAETYGTGSSFALLMSFIEALLLGNIEVTGADTSTATIVFKNASGSTIGTFEQPTTGATKGSRTKV